MKIEPLKSRVTVNKTLGEIRIGVVFTWGSQITPVVRTETGIFQLRTDSFLILSPAYPLDDYVEYPNAKVVLE